MPHLSIHLSPRNSTRTRPLRNRLMRNRSLLVSALRSRTVLGCLSSHFELAPTVWPFHLCSFPNISNCGFNHRGSCHRDFLIIDHRLYSQPLDQASYRHPWITRFPGHLIMRQHITSSRNPAACRPSPKKSHQPAHPPRKPAAHSLVGTGTDLG